MKKWIESTGKSVEEALQKALKQLNLDQDSVSYEIITRAKNGFLGIGSCPAKVKVTYEVPDEVKAPEVKPEPEQKPAASAPVKKPTPEQKPAAPAPVKKPTPEQKPAAPAPVKKPAAPAPVKKAVTPVAQPTAAPKAEAKPVNPADDDKAARISAFLEGLLGHLDVQAVPDIKVSEEGIYQVDLLGENLGALIGRRGETLDAIQQLTNYAVNHDQSKRVRIHIDAEHYRAKREESLQRLACKTAGKAIKYRRNMMLEPMNAYERHVIHAALQEFDPSISTYSTGTEPNRRIVVAYNRNPR